MLLRSSKRTSNSKALSTISRFVFRRVSFRALRIKPSLMLILVRAMESLYTNFGGIGVSRATNVGLNQAHELLRVALFWPASSPEPAVGSLGPNTPISRTPFPFRSSNALTAQRPLPKLVEGVLEPCACASYLRVPLRSFKKRDGSTQQVDCWQAASHVTELCAGIRAAVECQTVSARNEGSYRSSMSAR